MAEKAYEEANAVDSCLEDIRDAVLGGPDEERLSPGDKIAAIAAALATLAATVKSKALAQAVDFKDITLDGDLGLVNGALGEIRSIVDHWYGGGDNGTKLSGVAEVLETLKAQLAAGKSIAADALSFKEVDSRLQATPVEVATSIIGNILGTKKLSAEKQMHMILDVVGDLGFALEEASKSPPGRPHRDGTPAKHSAAYAALAARGSKRETTPTPADQHVTALKELLGRVGGG